MPTRKPRASRRHPVVRHSEWISARTALLAKEKRFTKLRDDLSKARRALPWEKVEKPYELDGPNGTKTLADLFGTKSQLVVYHFMFGPAWEEGCKHCSFWADHYSAMLPHLAARDVAFVAISRAPLAKIRKFQKRMGWTFDWLSSGKTDFNYDFQASFTPETIASKKVFYNYATGPMNMQDREGISVFVKDPGGTIFHTYSCYARGIDMVNPTYQFLDLVPKGRDEDRLEFTQAWVRHHDRYAK